MEHYPRTPSSVSTASTRSTSSSLSLSEMDAVLAAAAAVEQEKVYVAVGKDVKEGKRSLLWAAKNFHGDCKLVVLYIHQPADRILAGFSHIPAEQLEEKELKAFRKLERQETDQILSEYLNFCKSSLKVQAEKLVIEKANVATGIADLIAQNQITKLVMGTSSYSKSRKAPKSKIAAVVHLKADPSCQIFFICNGTLACTREAEIVPANSFSQSDHLHCNSLPPGCPGSMGFHSKVHPEAGPEDPSIRQRSYSISYLPSNSGMQDATLSPWRRPIDTRSSAGMNSSPGPPSNLLDSANGYASQCHFQEETGASNEGEALDEVAKLRREVERLRRESSEELHKRQKAERELFDASMKFKQVEASLRRDNNVAIKEIEERLTKEKAELEKEQLRILDELKKTNEEKTALKRSLMETNSLLESLQLPTEELQRRREDAAIEAEEMYDTLSCQSIGSRSITAFTQFTPQEIQDATNNFDVSRKIGEGGGGSVYKGFLRHTTVAIKKLNHEGLQGEQEFIDEVGNQSTIRHPNLVTLIGACREAKVLVLEFLPNGSLEDRLQCKNTEPLRWRERVRIAAEICCALIFLHSNKPKGIVHGDLKPDNVLLDANNVSKLADFGISRELDTTSTTITPYHRTSNVKGTIGYMDPEYVASGELTAQYDVYSFGVVLLRLLTGRGPLGLQHQVADAIRRGCLHDVLDHSAGNWPLEQTRDLALLTLRCCQFDRKERADLAKDMWNQLEKMMNLPHEDVAPSSSSPSPSPSYFLCPITQEIMKDPYIAADGFTYEAEAIRDWFQKGNSTSPATLVRLAHRELIPNTALRFAIQEWLTQQK